MYFILIGPFKEREDVVYVLCGRYMHMVVQFMHEVGNIK